jgi:starch synthase (maltosyl-transferring)
VVGRLGLNDISPVVASGTLPAAAVAGERIPVSATVFREGHDAVAANVALRGPNGARIPFVRMRPGVPGTSRWHADVAFDT